MDDEKKKVKQAIALEYDPSDEAPRVVASGKGILADKIIEKARESSVPIHRDDKLADTLSRLDIGEMIPPELYEVVAEIAPLPFQRRADEPCEVDAQHHAEDAAAGKGDEYKADHPPDLPLQQQAAAEPQPVGDGAVNKQLDSQYQNLPRHQNIGQVRDAIAAILALQLIQPVVHVFRLRCGMPRQFHVTPITMTGPRIQENPRGRR